MDEKCQSLRLVKALIGQVPFEQLLIRMPDGFFSLLPETKDWIWDELLNAVNQGIEDPQALAVIADKLIKGEPVSVAGAGQLSSNSPSLQRAGLACSVDEYNQEIAEKLKKEHGDEPVFEVGL
jgi:hypothetical protein